MKTMNNLEAYYLMHHGIKGQKWGDQNGPPYPLNESDKSSTEKRLSRKEKTKSMQVGDVKTAKKHIAEYSNEELQQLLDRHNFDKQLDRQISQIDRKPDYVANTKKLLNNTKDIVVVSGGILVGATVIYNTAAKTTNAVLDMTKETDFRMPVIGNMGGKKKKK